MITSSTCRTVSPRSRLRGWTTCAGTSSLMHTAARPRCLPLGPPGRTVEPSRSSHLSRASSEVFPPDLQYHIFTAHKRSFHRCLSVHRVGLPHCMLGYSLGHTTPWADTSPLGRHTPGRQPSPGQRTPSGQTLPLCSVCWDAVNKRAVRIPLECFLVTHFFGKRRERFKILEKV